MRLETYSRAVNQYSLPLYWSRLHLYYSSFSILLHILYTMLRSFTVFSFHHPPQPSLYHRLESAPQTQMFPPITWRPSGGLVYGLYCVAIHTAHSLTWISHECALLSSRSLQTPTVKSSGTWMQMWSPQISSRSSGTRRPETKESRAVSEMSRPSTSPLCPRGAELWTRGP